MHEEKGMTNLNIIRETCTKENASHRDYVRALAFGYGCVTEFSRTLQQNRINLHSGSALNMTLKRYETMLTKLDSNPKVRSLAVGIQRAVKKEEPDLVLKYWGEYLFELNGFIRKDYSNHANIKTHTICRNTWCYTKHFNVMTDFIQDRFYQEQIVADLLEF